MANDFDSRSRKVSLPHAALQLQKESQKLRGSLCSRGCARVDTDAMALPYGQGTPNGQIHCKIFQAPQKVVRLTDLEDPVGCSKDTERDLRRYGGNLGMLRQCAADHATDTSLFEPFPSPVACKTSPCGAAGGRITGTNNLALRLWSLKEGGPAQRKKESTILPRVEGRHADIDELPRVWERPGPRGQERRDGLSSGSSTTACSRASSQCTNSAEYKLAKRPVSQRGRKQSGTDEWPPGDVLNLVW